MTTREPTEQGVSETQVDGAVLDSPGPCGHVITIQVPNYGSPWGGPNAFAHASVGDVWNVAQRITRKTDDENLATDVIRRDDSTILLAIVVGARPEFIDTDLLGGLVLSVPRKTICTGGVEGHFALSTNQGDAACEVDSRSEACCSLWGKPYEVQSQAAAFYLSASANQPWAQINFDIRLPGFLSHR